ncbi:MAG: M48 family metallopeptidase [Saprospiraceae bacterium]|nr:M48 family metallopeptidase [Saprospiraceae bacterium]MBK9728846.1 M48 family metallopeptidase [Saprospiraceae bacterium]
MLLLVAFSCTKNLVTGRKQLNLVSESELQVMALKEYTNFLSTNKVLSTSSNKNAEMVKRVGTKIANGIKTYYDSKGQTSILEGYKWEFNLVENNDVNAWCMPGGKVVVYTGLLPITKNENALAIVLGHEIAHAVAQHGSERMSQGLLQQLGGTALQVALSSKPVETQNLYLAAYGIGSTVGAILPFSRKEENEADQYGLYFAAMAGYDPNEAIPFWQRMASTGSSKPPEFLSSHPSDKTRIEKLKANMPQAMKYYKTAKK